MAARRHRDRTLHITVALAVVAAGAVMASCDSDQADEPSLVTLDDSFDGDAFDAACALLDEAAKVDADNAVAISIETLAEIGGEEAAINTLQVAVDDRCPEWHDALEAELEARG